MTEKVNSNDMPSNPSFLIKAFESAKSGGYDDLSNYILCCPDELDAVIPKEYGSIVGDPDLIGGRTLSMVLAKFKPTSVAQVPEYISMLHAMKLHVDFNQRADSGATAPMFASHNGNMIALDFFACCEDVDWKKRTTSGYSTYDFAADNFHYEALTMLAEKVPDAVTADTAWVFLKQKLTGITPEKRIDMADRIERTLCAIEAASKQKRLFEAGMRILDADIGDKKPDMNHPFIT